MNYQTCAKRSLQRYKDLGDLKNAVLSGEYNPLNEEIFSRVLLWKAVLLFNSLDVNKWGKILEDSRIGYKNLNKQFKPPYYKLSEESEYYLNSNSTNGGALNNGNSFNSSNSLKNLNKPQKLVKNEVDQIDNPLNPLSNIKEKRQ